MCLNSYCIYIKSLKAICKENKTMQRNNVSIAISSGEEICMEMGNVGFPSLPRDFFGNGDQIVKLMRIGRI